MKSYPSAVGPTKRSFSTEAPTGAFGSGLAITASRTTVSFGSPYFRDGSAPS